MSLILQDLRVRLGAFQLHVNVKLTGNIAAIFGPSGAGKTTVLEAVAGIRQPLTGMIRVDDLVLTDTGRGIAIPTERRQVGYVPQDLALFPHMSVFQNLKYGLKPLNENENSRSLERIANLLEIKPLLNRSIFSLSGGEQQRVAYARAVLASPRLLLLDEPLGSLDDELKEKMILHLRKLRGELNIPMLYVTHDANEVARLADEVIVLRNGEVMCQGKPDQIFRRVDTQKYLLPGSVNS
jgi:molybdate transport system ATP-binding protein